MTDTVSLSEIPDAGNDLEDYVAALFQASGYYVEKSLIERDPDDVLELDIVASKYDQGDVRRVLAEVKGGGWGYPDIFKIVGWMKYLGIREGGFLVKKPDEHLSQIRERVAKLGVTLAQFDDFSTASEVFAEAGLGTPRSANLVELWRFSYAAERALVAALNNRFKSDKDRQGPREARGYHRLINDGTFFAQSPEESLRLLYDAYIQHPKFTAANAAEIDGHGYMPQGGGEQSGSLREALRSGAHPYLQGCMYLDHRARLAILKAATDHIIQSPKEGGLQTIWDLPASLQSAIQWLREQPTFWQYVTFWQQLLWGWGGFILEERLNDEYAWMATCSGIPEREVPTALQAFDKFFPLANGWFRTVGWSSVKQLVLMPTAFKGLGAHYRREQYEEKDFRRLAPSGYSANDLASWNNHAVEFLSK